MEIIDISVPIRPGMVVYEGDPPVFLERALAITQGAAANVSRLDFGVHSGTHVDAPVHFIEGAPGADALPLDALLGPAEVVDATGVEALLDEEALRRLAIPDGAERVLFKTANSALWDLDEFTPDFVRVTADGARHLVRRGVRLVGMDYLSVGDQEVHVELLRAGAVPLESLDLRDVEPGPYQLFCLPLRIIDSDGAPARAVLIRDRVRPLAASRTPDPSARCARRPLRPLSLRRRE